MDPKVIEMNNLRVLNDYLNQTLDVLVRGQRFAGPAQGVGYSPFGGQIPGAAGSIGTDTVYGPGAYGYGFAGSPAFGGLGHTPFAATNPFTGLPLVGGGYGAFGPWQQSPWGQTPWSAGQTPWAAGQGAWGDPRQAQVTQALAAKQTVLEAMCRMAGIPV